MFNDYNKVNQDAFNEALMESITSAVYNDDIEKIYIRRASGAYFRDINGKIHTKRALMKDGVFFDEDIYMTLVGVTIQSVRRLIPSKTLLIEFSDKAM